MNITSPDSHAYSVGVLLGETPTFKLYECTLPDGGQGILKISTEVAFNGLLDREAYILQTMWDRAMHLEQEYEKIKTGPEYLNYQFFFPRIIESFISLEQGKRRINILSFTQIAKKLSDLVPLSHIVTRDRVRVDPKTSAWILGRMLKYLEFTHSLKISIGFFDPENILINREEHQLAVFDWTQASISADKLNMFVTADEVSRAAKETIVLLGGNVEDGTIPEDEQLEDDQYRAFLDALAQGRQSDAGKARTEFYTLILALWPKRGFHNFKAYPLD